MESDIPDTLARSTIITYLSGSVLGANCYVIDRGSQRILVDFGLEFVPWDEDEHPLVKEFYGRKVVPPQFDPSFFDDKKIDAVIFTHNHLDHCGGAALLLPYLEPHARIFARPITNEVLEFVLRDTMKNSPYLFHIFQRDRTLALREDLPFGEFEILPGWKIFVKDAGHLPGAISIIFDLGDDERGIITGDVALHDQPIVPGTKMFSESVPSEWLPNRILGTDLTHGSEQKKFHYDHELEKFVNAVAEVHNAGGHVVCAAFAHGRGQQVAVALARRGFMVYVDGAIRQVLKMYQRHLDFDFPHDLIRFVEDDKNNKYRKELIESEQPRIVITTAGMGDEGPIGLYMRAWLPYEKNAVFFTSYLAPGSTGARLLKISKSGIPGTIELKSDNDNLDEVAVCARIGRFHLSAHADLYDFATLIEDIVKARGGKKLRSIYLTHGTPQTLNLAKDLFAFYADLIDIPKPGEMLTLVLDTDVVAVN